MNDLKKVINYCGYQLTRTNNRYEYTHRLVMQKALKRNLKKYEVVHHKDGNKLNNSLENLEILFKKEHDKLSAELRWKLNPESFKPKRICGKPRVSKERRRKWEGQPCQRSYPCFYHRS